MSNKRKKAAKATNNATELGRGDIKDNFWAAIVTSRVYKMQVVQSKKGKGSYQRKAKNVGRESYLMAA